VTGDETARPPVPDPTVLTTEALLRAVGSERDYVDGRIAVLEERLRAIDVATRLLNETVNRVPTDVTKEVTHLRELMTEMFGSVKTQFNERDMRGDRESRDNKVAVDAAFAAQKEAAAKQDESNAKAINKSEVATGETINKLAELQRSVADGLADKIDDLKSRIGAVEASKQGGRETLSGVYALAGFLVSILAIAGLLAATGAFTK
jgi:cation transport regulator ChaB